MAKKTAEVTEEKSAVIKDIIKKYGKVISSGNTILEQRSGYDTISISPAIDIALGGGIREGSWLILTSEPKAGKTTTALQIAANCQAEGRPVIYVDAEGRLKQMNLQGVKNLDVDKLQVVHSEDKPLSAEEFLEITVKLVSDPSNYRAVCIIDSTSNLIPQKELEEDVQAGRAGLPRLLSNFCKKLCQIVPQQRTTMVIVTHYIANTSGYGASKMPDCGKMIQYQADTRMEVKSIEPWEIEKRQIGQAVNWKVICSSMGPPGRECQSWIKYGDGIDRVQELLIIGQELGLISNGTWKTLEFLLNETDLLKQLFPDLDLTDTEAVTKSVKFQGQAKTYEFLSEHKVVSDLLEKKIKEML